MFPRFSSIALALLAACAAPRMDEAEHARFVAASRMAVVQGLREAGDDVQRVLVLDTGGDSRLVGPWSERKTLERRQRERRAAHTAALEALIRSYGWEVVEADDETLRRLRLQHRRVGADLGISLATHVGSSLGADVVVEPEVHFHYETRHDASDGRWTWTLDWRSEHAIVDARSDRRVAMQVVDTREPMSVARWTDPPEPGALTARAANAMRATGDGVEASALAWMSLHLASYGMDVAEVPRARGIGGH
ncbi:MAG: hypothetical protein AAGB93_19850 [Planctomycetota bacterium]